MASELLVALESLVASELLVLVGILLLFRAAGALVIGTTKGAGKFLFGMLAVRVRMRVRLSSAVVVAVTEGTRGLLFWADVRLPCKGLGDLVCLLSPTVGPAVETLRGLLVRVRS